MDKGGDATWAGVGATSDQRMQPEVLLNTMIGPTIRKLSEVQSGIDGRIMAGGLRTAAWPLKLEFENDTASLIAQMRMMTSTDWMPWNRFKRLNRNCGDVTVGVLIQ